MSIGCCGGTEDMFIIKVRALNSIPTEIHFNDHSHSEHLPHLRSTPPINPRTSAQILVTASLQLHTPRSWSLLYVDFRLGLFLAHSTHSQPIQPPVDVDSPWKRKVISPWCRRRLLLMCAATIKGALSRKAHSCDACLKSLQLNCWE